MLLQVHAWQKPYLIHHHIHHPVRDPGSLPYSLIHHVSLVECSCLLGEPMKPENLAKIQTQYF